MVNLEISRNKSQVRCALYLLLFAGVLAILIGSMVLSMTFNQSEASIGLRSVGALFLCAGFFGLLTGSMVKFGTKKLSGSDPARASRHHRRNREDGVYVEINGAISRLPLRYPMYNQYFYQIVQKMNERKQIYVPTSLPSYEDVVQDQEGKQFSFIPDKSPTGLAGNRAPKPGLQISSSIGSPPPYHVHLPPSYQEV